MTVNAAQGNAGLIASAVEELRGRPLACAVAFFAVGIWAGAKCEIPAAWALGAAIAASGLALLSIVWQSRRLRLQAGRDGQGLSSLPGRLLHGVGVFSAVFILILAALAGGFAYSLSQVKRAGDICIVRRAAATFEGVVVGDPHQWGDRQAMAVELRARVNPATGARSAARGRAWLTCVSREPLERGDLIRFTGIIAAPREQSNPGELTRAPALQAAGLSVLAYVGDERLMERLGAAQLGPLERAGIAFREYVSRIMRDSMPGPYREVLGALLGSIVFGAKAHPLPPEVMDSFRRAGVVHVLVVSGSQISLLFTIVYAPGALALWLRRRRHLGQVGDQGWVAPAPARASLGAVLALIALYALFTEGGRSVARAAVMGGVAALGLMLRRMPSIAEHHGLESDHYTMLAVAALALLVVHPEGIFDIGLQLSLGAVLGLVFLGPKIMRALKRLPRWIGVVISATTSAQLAVLPIMAWHFGYISPVGFIANLFIIPAAAFLLVTGIAVIVLGSVSLPLAAVVNYVNAPLLLSAVRLTYVMSNLRWSTLRVDLTSPWPVAGYYLGLILLATLLGRWLSARAVEDELTLGGASPAA